MSDPHADPGAHSTADPATPGAAAHAGGEAHGPDDAHGSGGDEHGHGEALGPIDWVAWGAGVAGLLIGLGTALAFAIATNRLG